MEKAHKDNELLKETVPEKEIGEGEVDESMQADLSPSKRLKKKEGFNTA